MSQNEVNRLSSITSEQARRFGILASRSVDTTGDYALAQEFLIEQFGDDIEPLDNLAITTTLRRAETAKRYLASRNIGAVSIESILLGIQAQVTPEDSAETTIKASNRLLVTEDKYGDARLISLRIDHSHQMKTERTKLTGLFNQQTSPFWWGSYIPPVPLAVIKNPEVQTESVKLRLPAEPILKLGELTITRRRQHWQSKQIRQSNGQKPEDFDEIVAMSQGRLR